MKHFFLYLCIALCFLSISLLKAGETVLSGKAIFKFYLELCDDSKTGNSFIDGKKIDSINDMIQENREKSLDRIWNNRFNPNVPKCIQQLMDSLKNTDKIDIDIWPAYKKYGEDNDLIPVCVSDVSKNPYKTGYLTDRSATAGGGKITIYGVWREFLKQEKYNCLDGILQHELIHVALFKNQKNSIDQHIATNSKLKFTDEGIAEDCTLRYFPCAGTPYADKNDASNPDGDDCDCKKVCVPCEDYCPPGECGSTPAGFQRSK